MSKSLIARVIELEKKSVSGSLVFGVWDDAEPLGVDGTPMVLISGSDTRLPLPEFERLYPDGIIYHVVYDMKIL